MSLAIKLTSTISSIFIALFLKGSLPGKLNKRVNEPSAEMQAEMHRAMSAYADGEYQRARLLFHTLAVHAGDKQVYRTAAMNWNNAGACSLALMQYGPALKDFTHAKRIAENARLAEPLANTLNNIAALYLHTGQPEDARRVAAEGLPAAAEFPKARARIRFQLAYALTQLNRFNEAEPAYRLSINELLDEGDLDTAARELGLFGSELVRGRRFPEAEWALSEALRLTRTHNLRSAGNILRGLANLRSEQGDWKSAAILFNAAIAAPANLTPRWGIYMDRGRFLLREGKLAGALSDFREARRIAFQVRADMVPADQERVTLDDAIGGLGNVLEGLVASGNLLARQTGNGKLFRETFDAAEQDRLWSLRALLPVADDWRTRLPVRYWELLANYQAAERTAIAGTPAGTSSDETSSKAFRIKLEMHQIEVAAAGPESGLQSDNVSPLAHVRSMLDKDSILLSFHVTKTSSWVWAVDRRHTDVYPLPSTSILGEQVAEFSRAIRTGKPSAELGKKIYSSLFGAIPRSYLKHKHWLLEPDGPLYELPFAALVTGQSSTGNPDYLIERVELQSIPSALLLQHGTFQCDRGFLGIGDPVYNVADSRFSGAKRNPELTLPRLPNTARELDACAREWNPGKVKLLNGTDARLAEVEAAIQTSPAVIHFATHVVTSRDEFRPGLIALSLNSDGSMGLLGPKDIVARPVKDSVVVMDGCHSSQGDALATGGPMGLTRAWIGAGARAVVATQWDIPDDAAQSLMKSFYRALNSSPGKGLASALRHAQLAELNSGPGKKAPERWAGYYLLSRI